MSALSGIWQWTARSVDDSALAVLAAHNREAGPDGGGAATPAPGLAMQAHLFRFDSWSGSERQPYRFANGSVVTFDGRLDNREDLLTSLHHDLGPDQTDVALVAAGYLKWGREFLNRILGDWSIALWDAQAETLLLARDFMGNRPLYYREMQDGVAWSTRIEGLVEAFDLYARPDEGYIAGVLASTKRPLELTPFETLRVLRAGHMLEASRSRGIRVNRYWTYEPTTIRYRDPRDYTHRLRELLIEGVRVRLRTTQRVWSHLSGGLDSSTVVCLANALIQRREVQAPAIQPVSWLISSSLESDEREYMGAVERWTGLRTYRSEYVGIAGFDDHFGHIHPETQPPVYWHGTPVLETADRILLTGQGGDLLMLHGGMGRLGALVEALGQGPTRFLRIAYHYADKRDRPLASTLAHFASEAMTSEEAKFRKDRRKMIAQQAAKAGIQSRDIGEVYGLTPTLAARVPAWFIPRTPDVSAFSRTKRILVSGLYTMADVLSAQYGLEGPLWPTHPFTHRPVVAFMLGVPHLAFWDPRVGRAGMKKALADILPPEILARTTKGDPRAARERAKREWMDTFRDIRARLGPATEWELVKRGYLRKDILAAVVDPPGRVDYPVRDWVRLEAWLRTLSDPPRLRGHLPDSRTITA